MITSPTHRDALRAELRQERKSAAARHPNAADIILQNFQRINLPIDKIVAGYIAVNSEMDPAPILQFLAAQKTSLCLPVVTATDQPMQFREYIIGDELIQNDLFPFPEPAIDRKIITPQVLLIPLLGFDRAGNRIGSGKGFYDRTLAVLRAQNKNTLAIGLGYAEQETDEITVQPHDQPLNFVVTPRETIYCPAP